MVGDSNSVRNFHNAKATIDSKDQQPSIQIDGVISKIARFICICG